MAEHASGRNGAPGRPIENLVREKGETPDTKNPLTTTIWRPVEIFPEANQRYLLIVEDRVVLGTAPTTVSTF